MKIRVGPRSLLGLAFFAGALTPPVQAQSSQVGVYLGAFIGRWTIDPAQTRMGRNGPGQPNILRSASFTFLFRPAAQGIRMDVYAQFPQPAPTRSMAVVPDGRPHPCEGPASCLTAGGDPKDQTFVVKAIDQHLITRLLYVNGRLYDSSTMAVSADGRTLTLISWAPETPQYQNIQVFEKQP